MIMIIVLVGLIDNDVSFAYHSYESNCFLRRRHKLDEIVFAVVDVVVSCCCCYQDRTSGGAPLQLPRGILLGNGAISGSRLRSRYHGRFAVMSKNGVMSSEIPFDW